MEPGMVTIISLAKDERSARVALAATLEPDDAVTGRLIAAVAAVETVRLAAGTGTFPKTVICHRTDRTMHRARTRDNREVS
jgi:hypothetical protein